MRNMAGTGTPDPLGNAVATVSYTHEKMVDLIVANPHIRQADLARHFGYTQAWVSRVIRSDAFRERMAARREELVDPLVLQSLEQRFQALVDQSLEILQEQLQAKPSADLALRAADLGARALGYGARAAGVQVNQQFVVHMPQKAASTQEWLESRSVVNASE